MNQKYTPGPYVVDVVGFVDPNVPHTDWIAVGIPDEDGDVAEVVAYCAEANAPLLAAAPELLAALRELLAVEAAAEEQTEGMEALFERHAIATEAARAAIAKAEG